MSIDTVLIMVIVMLSTLLALGFLKLSRENPKLLGGVGGFCWDKYIEVFQPKRNYSILEDPEEDE
mgnify:CR=1 FL=1